MPLPSLSPILFKDVEFRDGMGLGISPCSLLFQGVEYDRPSLNPSYFSEKVNFLFVSFSEHMECMA